MVVWPAKIIRLILWHGGRSTGVRLSLALPYIRFLRRLNWVEGSATQITQFWRSEVSKLLEGEGRKNVNSRLQSNLKSVDVKLQPSRPVELFLTCVSATSSEINRAAWILKGRSGFFQRGFLQVMFGRHHQYYSGVQVIFYAKLPGTIWP